MLRKLFAVTFVSLILFPAWPSAALERQQCVPAVIRGATVYLPVYSHISHGDKLRPFNLAVTISLRNTDPAAPVTLGKAEYYDEKGKLIRNLISTPVVLTPLSSYEHKIKESDVAGGSGGSVVVKWSSEGPAAPLLAESIMIGTSSAQGISFSSRGSITSFEP